MSMQNTLWAQNEGTHFVFFLSAANVTIQSAPDEDYTQERSTNAVSQSASCTGFPSSLISAT